LELVGIFRLREHLRLEDVLGFDLSNLQMERKGGKTKLTAGLGYSAMIWLMGRQ
jgi:hypothetical protein